MPEPDVSDDAGGREALRHFDPVRLGPALARVEAALENPECRIVLVTGSAGAGKTTLLAALASRHADWARYFIGPGPDGGLRSFLVTIGNQMARVAPPAACEPPIKITERTAVEEVAEGGSVIGIRLGEFVRDPFSKCEAIDVEVTVGDVWGRVDGMVARRFLTAGDYPPEALAEFALFRPARRMAGRLAVVLIDGVDRLPASGPGNDLLRWLSDAEAPPANVRFVVAGRGDFGRLSTLRVGHRRTLREIEL